MYLIDTNIFLEILLSQERKDVCKTFLDGHSDQIHISDFSVHSIGVILFRYKKGEVFKQFAQDILAKADIVSLTKNLYEQLPDQIYGLDFDDLYQLHVAREREFTFVTMDTDFKKVISEVDILFLQEDIEVENKQQVIDEESNSEVNNVNDTDQAE